MESSMFWLFFTLGLFVTAVSSQPDLTIMPSGAELRKDVGSHGVFTCMVSQNYTSLISDLIWLGPDGVKVASEKARIRSRELPSSSGLELYIDNVKSSDAGTYTCRASYGGQIISKSFRLSIYMSIRWEDAPKIQNPLNGTRAKIKCVVKSNPVATIEWLRNDQFIESGGRYVVEQDGLAINNVSPSDDGSYICRAKVPQRGEIEERPINVEVFYKPKITNPKDGVKVEVVEGQAGSVRCEATGKPLPKKRWVDENNVEVSVTEGLSVDADSGTLRFNPAAAHMIGGYRCIAENKVGSESISIEVLVQIKPRLNSFNNATADEGDEAALRCEVLAVPNPTMYFRKLANNKMFRIANHSSIKITAQMFQEDKITVGVLKFSNLKRKDDGLYECVAINKVGQMNRIGHVTVRHAPVFAETPKRRIATWENHAQNLTCAARAIPNATVSWWFRGRPVATDDSNLLRFDKPLVSLLQVNPVDSTYYGNYTCQATNILGANDLQIELFQVYLPAGPASIDVQVVTATTLQFGIAHPSSDGGTPVLTYRVQYKLLGESWDDAREKVWPLDSKYVLGNLKPERIYLLRFAAKNKVGMSKWTAEIRQTMNSISAPEPPIFLYNNATPVQPGGLLEAEPGSSYVVHWRAGPDNGAAVNSMEITFFQVDNVSASGWKRLGDKRTAAVTYPGTRQYRLTPLSALSLYRIELRARNELGLSRGVVVYLRTATADGKVDPSITGRPSSTSLSPSVIGVIILLLLLLLLVLGDLACCVLAKRGFIHSMRTRARAARATAKPGERATTSEKEPLQVPPTSAGETQIPEEQNLNSRTDHSHEGVPMKTISEL